MQVKHTQLISLKIFFIKIWKEKVLGPPESVLKVDLIYLAIFLRSNNLCTKILVVGTIFLKSRFICKKDFHADKLSMKKIGNLLRKPGFKHTVQ